MKDIEIIDVTPRDGLQNEPVLVGVDDKIDLINGLAALGVKRIEAASFVSPRHVPQMADAEETLRGITRVEGVRYAGLVVNDRGTDRAIAAGVDELNYVLPVTEAFAVKNQNTTVAAATAMAVRAGERAAQAGIGFTVSFAVAFGCPYAGRVSSEDVLRVLLPMIDMTPIDEIVLADTIGSGTPWSVTALIDRVAARTDIPLRMHFHETRHTSLANTTAALSAGVQRFDGSVGGLGGCPFAPGAAGNAATEDLAWLLSEGGYEHGMDIERAVELGRWICAIVGAQPRSGLGIAGVFPSPDL